MGGIRRAGIKALETCELQALSRRNLNILLAEYPEVADELKRVAKRRAKVKRASARQTRQTIIKSNDPVDNLGSSKERIT